jgi:hypothetical protein
MGNKVIQGNNTFQHNCTKKRGKNNMGNIVIQGNSTSQHSCTSTAFLISRITLNNKVKSISSTFKDLATKVSSRIHDPTNPSP